jgi:ribokinase
MKKVAGLGQCSLDYIASVDTYPEEDTKPEVLDWSDQGGGPVATALVALTRLGVKTTFIGTISNDLAGEEIKREAGEEIKRELKKEGVDTKGLIVKKGGRSQTAFVVVNRNSAKRTIFWQRPTVRGLRPAEVKATLIKTSAFLLLDGLMVDASFQAARIARRYGIPVMLDAGGIREGMMELCKLSDYIVCSEEFSYDLAGTPSKTLKELSLLRPRACTITLGERGSVTWSNGERFRQGAFRVRAVDTTGAGDVFHGGYIYGLLCGWDIKKTVRFASAFAALKCLKPGGRTGIPTLKETLRFIKITKELNY